MTNLKVLILIGIVMICQKLTGQLIKISNWAVAKCCPDGLPTEDLPEECQQLTLFDNNVVEDTKN